MLPLRSAITACLAVVLAVGTGACGSSEPERPSGAPIGAAADTQLKGGDKARLLLPTGKLQVSTGEPVTSLDPEQTRDRRAYDAPTGTTYLPLAWRLRGKRFAALQEYVDADPATTVDLVTGGDSYRLPPPSRGGGWRSFYVPVEGDGTDVRLEVGFDGVTQTVDLRSGERDTGRAAALYELPGGRPPETSCADAVTFEMPRGAAEYTCEVTGPTLLPYAAGKWAPQGSQWLVVDVRTSLARIAQPAPDGDGGAWWNADDVRTQLRAGGAEPTSLRRPRSAADACPGRTTKACGFAAVAIFAVEDDPPRTLEVEQTHELVRGPTWGGYSPEPRRSVTASGSIRLATD